MDAFDVAVAVIDDVEGVAERRPVAGDDLGQDVGVERGVAAFMGGVTEPFRVAENCFEVGGPEPMAISGGDAVEVSVQVRDTQGVTFPA